LWLDCRWANRSAPSRCPIRRSYEEVQGSFYDKGLEGASHHAVIPNVNTIDKLRDVWPRLSPDERRLFDVIARAYLAALMPDFRYRQTTATLDVRGLEFRVTGRQPIDLGWRAAFPEWQPADEKGDEAQLLPQLRNGETTRLQDAKIEDKETPATAALQRRHFDRGDAECLALCR
jgi:DNA topoisomerase-3